MEHLKQIFLLILISFLAIEDSHAQFRYGIKAGLNGTILSNVKEKDDMQNLGFSIHEKEALPRLGATAGVVFNYRFKSVSFQSEINYLRQNYTYWERYYLKTCVSCDEWDWYRYNEKQERSLNYIEIAQSLKIGIISRFFLNIGGVGQILLVQNNKSALTFYKNVSGINSSHDFPIKTDNKVNHSRFNLGAIAGIGYDFGAFRRNLSIELRYTHILSDALPDPPRTTNSKYEVVDNGHNAFRNLSISLTYFL